MDLQLKDRTAVVTGASSGIGQGIATCLAWEGARLLLAARRTDALGQFADELAAEGLTRPAVVAADVTTDDGQQAIADAVARDLGAAEILVNSAGGHIGSGPAQDDEEWAAVLRLNFESQRRLTNQLLPGMRERGWGRVINVTGKSEPPRVSAEFAAKAAVHAWAKGLSRDVGPYGITVNSLAPGRIMTPPMTRRYTDAQRAGHVAEIPVGGYGQPEDIGRMAAFLASPLNGYITGIVIAVDGGLRRFPL